jgi:DDE superfamily endonuclease
MRSSSAPCGSAPRKAFALVMPYADTAAMQAFLDRFAETIAEDEPAVMVLDQAGWHGSNALAVPANVTLIPLPSYSPELNPVERVWLYLRERSSRTGYSPITAPLLTPPATPGTGSWPRRDE